MLNSPPSEREIINTVYIGLAVWLLASIFLPYLIRGLARGGGPFVAGAAAIIILSFLEFAAFAWILHDRGGWLAVNSLRIILWAGIARGIIKMGQMVWVTRRERRALTR